MISVIMPTHRIDEYFDVAVRSILASEGVELELIIVFDAIPADVSSLPWHDDPRLVYVRTPMRSGPGGSMAYGLEVAQGEFIARMDSDDRSLASRLSAQVAYLNAHPDVVAVSCRTTRIDAHGSITGDIDLPFGPDIRPHLLLHNVIPHSTLVVRREALDNVGGYRADLAQMEDYALLLALSLEGPIAQFEDRLLEYRVHSTQVSAGAPPRGAHIDAVLAGRRKLGRHLGVSRIGVEVKNVIWIAVQHLRARGLRKPGHAR